VNIAYQTDDQGYYTGTGICWPDPEDEHNVLMPFGAYAEAPPVAGENQVAKRVGNSWQLVADFRGVVYWTADRQQHTITEAEVEPPSGHLTDDPGPTPEQLAEAKRIQAKDLLASSDITVLRCFEAGVSLPEQWKTWRASLRAIASSGQGVIDAQPSYPAGT
jgi:hypothetical protein